VTDPSVYHGHSSADQGFSCEEPSCSSIYQHEARSADQRITGAIDAHVQAEKAKNGCDDDDPGPSELAG
jgi:hypothetical protein